MTLKQKSLAGTFCTILFLFFNSPVFAQIDTLRKKIEKIIAAKKADVGVAIYGFENNDTLSINGNKHFPMQSVFKFHIAVAVLNEIDKKKLSLQQNIYISQNDLLPDTWSPIRDKHPNKNITLSLDSILRYTVSQSDNNGCDILLKLIGGVETVQNHMDLIGIKDFSIRANEREMSKGWDVQFSNWTTALSSVQLLKMLYYRKGLSKKCSDYLWKIMTETSTGKNRIKGQLPAAAIVAHKTGTSSTNELGITAAVNDIGIVVLPNGKHFAISIFVSNSKENEETNEKIIADITKLTWDFYTNNRK